MATANKRPPMMGVSIYRSNTQLGKAAGLTIEGSTVCLGFGIIDRFEVLRYLAPHVARDLIGEKSIPNMPPIVLYCDPSSIKGRKKKAGEGTLRITIQPQSIEVIPMPGQNLSLKSLKGTIVGPIEVGVDTPEQVITDTPVASGATVLY